MTKMTGGQALVKALHREGVRVIFGMPGVQLYHIMDALYDQPDIKFIAVRHEQAAAYMAYGYSRAGRDIGTALVVPGPGLQNASAGIGTAYAASTPILVVSGQISSDTIGLDKGELHEVNEQLDIVKPVTKWRARVTTPTDTPNIVHEAFHQLRTGRPRPVEIEFPPDILGEIGDVQLREPSKHNPLKPDGYTVQKVARIISASNRPVIWAGGGVITSGASKSLQQLAEHLQAPVIVTGEGKGALSDHHYLALGTHNYINDSVGEYVEGCDLILAVGTRLARPTVEDGHRIIQIDVDNDEIGRNYPVISGIHGDARLTLEALCRKLSSSPQRPSRRMEVKAVKAQRMEAMSLLQPQGPFVQAIRSAMPDDSIVVEGVTQIGYASRVYYKVYTTNGYINSSYFGNLGFTYPTALGAKIAQPDKAVVAISGDGGFLFNSQELATAVKYGINAVVIVFNDNAYGNVMRDQSTKFNGRVIGADLHNPNFVKLAEAYGARGIQVTNATSLESALREAIDIPKPTLIEVPVGPMPPIWE